MELIGSFFLILAVALAVALFVLRPFINYSEYASRMKEGENKLLDHQRSAVLAERDRVLTALQDLDFDHALGKVPAEDYRTQRTSLLNTGAEALRRLDEMKSLASQTGVGERISMEERIEAAVAARRVDSRSDGTNPTQRDEGFADAANHAGNGKVKDELEELIASRKRLRKESAAGFCPRCGRPVQKSDKFCSRCGATI